MSPEDWLSAEMQGEIVALVHSHPGGLPWLSEADRRLQVQSDLPWWLVCRGAIHKFRCVPHLTGRRFEHGVTDCYTLFRDAYHLAGIEMPDFHRGDDWWRHGQNLYLDNMEATGFYRVPLDGLKSVLLNSTPVLDTEPFIHAHRRPRHYAEPAVTNGIFMPAGIAVTGQLAILVSCIAE